MKTPEEVAKQWLETAFLFSCNCEQCSRELNIEAFKAGFQKGYALGVGATAEDVIIESIKVINEKNS